MDDRESVRFARIPSYPGEQRGLAQSGAVERTVPRAIRVTEQTYFRWRTEYRGLQVGPARQRTLLKDESHRLRPAVSDLGNRYDVEQSREYVHDVYETSQAFNRAAWGNLASTWGQQNSRMPPLHIIWLWKGCAPDTIMHRSLSGVLSQCFDTTSTTACGIDGRNPHSRAIAQPFNWTTLSTHLKAVQRHVLRTKAILNRSQRRRCKYRPYARWIRSCNDRKGYSRSVDGGLHPAAGLLQGRLLSRGPPASVA